MLNFKGKFVIIYMYERKINVKKKKLIAFLLVASLMLTGCGSVATLKNGEEVIAKLNGKSITAEDLFDELKLQGGASVLTNMIDEFIVNKEIKTDDDAKSYAESQLNSYKQSYESYGQDFKAALKSAGYDGEDDFKDALITEYKKQMVTENYVKDELTDSEIEKYYNDNIFGDIEARHILISPNTDDDMSDEEKEEAEDKAKKEAEDIIKKLDKGEKFADLAKEYSDDEGTASKGGKLTVTHGAVVEEFWDGVNDLKDGEYSKEPVKSEYGYHIIYRIKQKEKPSLEDSRDEVIDDLVQEKISSDTTLQTKALVALRKKYDLEISDDKLKKSYDDLVSASLTTSSN